MKNKYIFFFFLIFFLLMKKTQKKPQAELFQIRPKFFPYTHDDLGRMMERKRKEMEYIEFEKWKQSLFAAHSKEDLKRYHDEKFDISDPK